MMKYVDNYLLIDVKTTKHFSTNKLLLKKSKNILPRTLLAFVDIQALYSRLPTYAQLLAYLSCR